MPQVIVFDVNETMLDVSALKPFFERVFGDGNVLQSWFQQVLQYSLVSTIAGPYFDFSKIAAAVLDMIAEGKGTAVSQGDRQELAERMGSLPPHPDVIVSLTRLHEHGVRLATLSNSAPAAIEKQLENAGIKQFFEQTLSVEMVKRYKPAAETYQAAASALAISPSEMTMVAAHAWDVAGAMQAGCKTAFVGRPGHVPFPLYPKPTFVVRDLAALADQLLDQQRS